MSVFRNISNRRKWCLAAPVLLVGMWSSGPAYAEGLDNSGDGSGTNNPDLLQTSSVCAAPCGVAAADQPINLYAPPPVIDEGDRLVPASEMESAPLTALQPGRNGMPFDADAPWFETDWSVRLRGSYIESTQGIEALVRVEPEFSLVHYARGGDFTLSSSAELNLDRNDTPRLAAVNVSAEQVYALDQMSNLSLSGNIALSQGSLNDPGVPDEVTVMPVELDGDVALGVERQFGQLGLQASGDISRKLMTATGTDGGEVSNNDRQYWKYGGALRAGYQLTPILTPFVQVDAHLTRFDEPPESDPTPLDGWDSNYLVGLEANWRDVLTAEVSAGVGMRQFEAEDLETMQSAVYGFSLDYTPDDALAVGAALSTTLNPGDPDAGLPRSITYAASADVNYALNSWLSLRGSLSGDVSEALDGSGRAVNYSGGVGADLTLTDHSSLTFDYVYDEVRATDEPVERAHEFSLGLMFSR